MGYRHLPAAIPTVHSDKKENISTTPKTRIHPIDTLGGPILCQILFCGRKRWTPCLWNLPLLPVMWSGHCLQWRDTTFYSSRWDTISFNVILRPTDIMGWSDYSLVIPPWDIETRMLVIDIHYLPFSHLHLPIIITNVFIYVIKISSRSKRKYFNVKLVKYRFS